jgi:DNA-binding transcriptional ArsR family regulator
MAVTEDCVRLTANHHDEDKVQAACGMFLLLSDQTRIRIVMSLARGAANVSQICNALQITQPTASHHLGKLRSGKIVTCRRAGKTVEYSLNNASMQGKSVLLKLPE